MADELDDRFRPDENMLSYASATIGPNATFPGEQSMEAISGALGIEEEVILGWFRNVGFLGWLSARQTFQMKGALPEVHRKMLTAALGGKAGSVKLFMERFDDEYAIRTGKGKFIGSGATETTEESFIALLSERSGCSQRLVLQLLTGKAKVVEVIEADVTG